MQKACLLNLTNNINVEPSKIVSTFKDIISFMMSKYLSNPLIPGVINLLDMGYARICQQFSKSTYTLIVLRNVKYIADRQQALVSTLSVESENKLSNSAINGFLLETLIGFKQKAKSFPEGNKLFKASLNNCHLLIGLRSIFPSKIQPGDQAKFHFC